MNQAHVIPYPYADLLRPTTEANDTAIERGILRSLPEGPLKILEVGCGNGHFAARLASLGHRVVAIDTSETGIALAKKSYEGRAQFLCHSAFNDLRVVGSDFDVVLAKEVVEHLTDPERFLINARDALRPGGLLVVSTPYHGYLKNLAIALLGKWDTHHGVDWPGGHIKFFSIRTLSSMIRNVGFHTLRFDFAGRCWGLWKSMIATATK